MSIPYQLVYGLLVMEVVTLLLLAAPLPLIVRKHIVKFVSSSPLLEKALFYLRITVIGVLVLFYDAAKRTFEIQSEVKAHKLSIKEGDHHHHLSADQSAVLHSKLFYSQRNMYLTGFTILLAIVLNRVFSLQKEVIKYKERSSVVVKQAENNTKQLSGLIEDKDKAEQQLKTMKEKLIAVEKLAKDAEVLKSQADSNYKQYMDLSDRYNSLESRVKRVAEEHGISLDVILGKGNNNTKSESNDMRRRTTNSDKKGE